VCALSIALSAQSPREISPRITRLEAWLSAVANHTPGEPDEALLSASAWNQEQLRFIWMEVMTLVSMIRQPDVDIFFVTEPPRPTGEPIRSLTAFSRGRPSQVFYRLPEQRRLREIAADLAPKGSVGRENDLLKRGAMLHADLAMLAPLVDRKGNDAGRPGPGAFTMFIDDGQQTGQQESVSHWNMGRRLVDRVRPPETKALGTVPDPGSDDTVRLWYLATCGFMARIRQIEPAHFDRAIELFPDDADILMMAAAVHESFAGVRTQAAMRRAKIPRDVSFGVLEEGPELRRSEDLYKRALEANPMLMEARIRLGRVLGRRGRHKEAVAQLQQGALAKDPLLQYYAHLFLGAELEALGNGADARRSYERATAMQPTAPSALLGLSRVADQTGDRVAARETIERMLELPPDEVERADPWWVYEQVHARHVDRLLADLRQRFVEKRL
jgi:hypothetical protein